MQLSLIPDDDDTSQAGHTGTGSGLGGGASDYKRCGATNSNDHGVWHPINPPLPEIAIQRHAGKADASEKVAALLEHRFDAANDGVATSEALEDAHRVEAAREGGHRDRIDKELRSRPETRSVLTSETFGEQSLWLKMTGIVALLFLALLLTPIPIVVAQGIAQSFAFEAIANDWRLGIPFGLPALGGIIMAGLLRQTLRPAKQDTYDRIVPALGVLALIGWAAGFAYTFLGPITDNFGGSMSTDLRFFYFGHLCLELMAGLGLTAMAERNLTAGRVLKVVPDEIKVALGEAAQESNARARSEILQADGYADRRKRLAAARTAYVGEGLAVLQDAETRRSAAIAQATLPPDTIH